MPRQRSGLNEETCQFSSVDRFSGSFRAHSYLFGGMANAAIKPTPFPVFNRY
jgi:hypothetical protein